MTEKDNVIVFDGSYENPVMNMLKYSSKNSEGEERTYIDKVADERVSSYRLLLVAHIAFGFHSWVVLISLPQKITEKKYIKTARRLMSLSFQCGVKIVNTVEVPQYV